jgi:D-3-phosphoglycerate dehydrogenase
MGKEINMKIVCVGDLLIPSGAMEKGFALLKDRGAEVKALQWELPNYEELQKINLLVEQGGSEVYEPPEYVFEAAKDADVLVVQFCTVTKKLIDACPKLKVVGTLRAGLENVNADYAAEKGILIVNTPGRNATAVADFTVGMMLAECRNIAKSHQNLKEGKWVRDYSNKKTVPDLSGKIVGIVGFGQIGRKVAQRLHGFEMEILAYDPFASNAPDYVKLVSLPELMAESDFVTIHARSLPETERMISRELLSKMKPDSYFINTARSSLVDEKALYEVLRDGKIAGAALDVFDVEPPGKDYPLVTLENVTITPHLAGGTVDAFLNSPKLLAGFLIDAFKKEGINI